MHSLLYKHGSEIPFIAKEKFANNQLIYRLLNCFGDQTFLPWTVQFKTLYYFCNDLFHFRYSKRASDPDLAPAFNLGLLEALLDCLPLLPCAYSAGGVKWYFTLLNRVKCMDVTSTSSSCAELLSAVSKHFHERASPLHAILKARCVFYKCF